MRGVSIEIKSKVISTFPIPDMSYIFVISYIRSLKKVNILITNYISLNNRKFHDVEDSDNRYIMPPRTFKGESVFESDFISQLLN